MSDELPPTSLYYSSVEQTRGLAVTGCDHLCAGMINTPTQIKLPARCLCLTHLINRVRLTKTDDCSQMKQEKCQDCFSDSFMSTGGSNLSGAKYKSGISILFSLPMDFKNRSNVLWKLIKEKSVPFWCPFTTVLH